MRQRLRTVSCLASALLLAGCCGNLYVVAPPANAPLPVAGAANPIDESRMITLHGNVHPLARPEFDQGLVNPATRLDRMLLVLNSHRSRTPISMPSSPRSRIHIRPSFANGSLLPS